MPELGAFIRHLRPQKIKLGTEMPLATAINDQILGSVAQINTLLVGMGPGVARSNLFVATSQALSNAAHNTSSSQQQNWVAAHAASVQGIAILYSSGTPSMDDSAEKVFA